MNTKKMMDAVNDQMNREFYSAYLYMAMSSYSTFVGMKGTANWFMVQYQEEMVHFTKFYNFLLSRGSHSILAEVQRPPADFKSVNDMFEQALKHEKFITASINDLVDLAIKENDHAANAFLQWFVTEQIEEESNVNDVLARLKLVGKDGNGLFMVDTELAKRVFTPPPATGADPTAA